MDNPHEDEPAFAPEEPLPPNHHRHGGDDEPNHYRDCAECRERLYDTADTVSRAAPDVVDWRACVRRSCARMCAHGHGRGCRRCARRLRHVADDDESHVLIGGAVAFAVGRLAKHTEDTVARVKRAMGAQFEERRDELGRVVTDAFVPAHGAGSTSATLRALTQCALDARTMLERAHTLATDAGEVDTCARAHAGAVAGTALLAALVMYDKGEIGMRMLRRVARSTARNKDLVQHVGVFLA